jgi:hypothetical protein
VTKADWVCVLALLAVTVLAGLSGGTDYLVNSKGGITKKEGAK